MPFLSKNIPLTISSTLDFDKASEAVFLEIQTHLRFPLSSSRLPNDCVEKAELRIDQLCSGK